MKNHRDFQPRSGSRDEATVGAATVIGVQMVDRPGSPAPHLAPPGGLNRVRTEAGAAVGVDGVDDGLIVDDGLMV